MGRGRFSGDGFDDEFPDDETSVDLAAVRRDDALIDAISGNGLVETKDNEEYELATLLADWRAEILAEPMPAGPDLDEVVAAVHRELGTRETLARAPEVTPLRPRSKGQLRLLRPLAGAAALVAIAVGSATAVSYGAEPGDPLWGVKQVVFSEQAQSTEARIDTTSTLERAEQLIAEGNTEEARELLTSAESRSGDVRDAEERDALGDWVQRLAEELGRLVPQVPPPPAAPVAPRCRWFPVPSCPRRSRRPARMGSSLPRRPVRKPARPCRPLPRRWIRPSCKRRLRFRTPRRRRRPRHRPRRARRVRRCPARLLRRPRLLPRLPLRRRRHRRRGRRRTDREQISLRGP